MFIKFAIQQNSYNDVLTTVQHHLGFIINLHVSRKCNCSAVTAKVTKKSDNCQKKTIINLIIIAKFIVLYD